MGSSPYGILSFGIAFDEDFEFPWTDRDKYDNDIKDWWLKVTGYVQPPELRHFSSIYDSKKKWLELNLLPIELVQRGYHDDSSYILATRSIEVEWDETLEINASIFDKSIIEEDSKRILDFLNKYNIQYEDNPKWLLSSFYG